MDRLIAGCALGAFLLALLVHLLTLCGVDISVQLPFVWLLKLGIFALFVPMLEAQTAHKGTNTVPGHPLAHCPLKAKAAIAAIVAYAFINFLVCEAQAPDGTLVQSDGRYTLQEPGKAVHELSSSEYRHLRVNELRSASGHWLVFYFLPFAFFLYRRHVAPAARQDTPS
ncbi:hypothetical protein [Chitinimonas sp.]|uniref:hypothetical protein n=1 Tax=Chitinimonas sp. TaxID=1934313 RepID=UPI002F93277D